MQFADRKHPSANPAASRDFPSIDVNKKTDAGRGALLPVNCPDISETKDSTTEWTANIPLFSIFTFFLKKNKKCTVIANIFMYRVQ